MTTTNTYSLLGGVKVRVMGPLAPSIQRRISTITYERGKSRTYGVARGERSLHVRVRVLSDADYSALLDLFNSTGEGAVYFDDLQRNLHSGYYFLGDLESDDQTHSSVVVYLDFTLYPAIDSGVPYTEEFI